jgi:hypothetical protein
MDDSNFTSLALKTIAGQATPAEVSAVQEALQQPARRWEYDELEEAFKLAREIVPAIEALEQTEAELPGYRRAELQAAVRAEFPADLQASEMSWSWWPRLGGIRGWSWAGAAILVLAVVLGSISIQDFSQIEIGRYAQDTTRSGENEEVYEDQPNVTIRQFRTETDYRRWWEQSWKRGVGTKVWFDEEKDEMHVVQRKHWRAGAVDVVYALPEDAMERRQFIRRILDELSGAKKP